MIFVEHIISSILTLSLNMNDVNDYRLPHAILYIVSTNKAIIFCYSSMENKYYHWFIPVIYDTFV